MSVAQNREFRLQQMQDEISDKENYQTVSFMRTRYELKSKVYGETDEIKQAIFDCSKKCMQYQIEDMVSLGYRKAKWSCVCDLETCEECSRLDQTEIELMNKESIVPPLHYRCRCVLDYYDEDKDEITMIKHARDRDGNSIQIPKNMSYLEWKKTYID